MGKKFILKPENEPLILEAFSVKNLKKVRDFNKKKPARQRNRNRKLNITDLFILS